MPSQAPYRDTLVVHFFGDLLQRTMDTPTAAAHQQALQGFLEEPLPVGAPPRAADPAGPSLYAL